MLEMLRWPASEGYGVSRSSKGLQTASARSMIRQRRQNQLSQAVTGAGREWPDKSRSVDLPDWQAPGRDTPVTFGAPLPAESRPTSGRIVPHFERNAPSENEMMETK
jgi:hypothetical protein